MVRLRIGKEERTKTSQFDALGVILGMAFGLMPFSAFFFREAGRIEKLLYLPLHLLESLFLLALPLARAEEAGWAALFLGLVLYPALGISAGYFLRRRRHEKRLYRPKL